jgi:REP element-mobilizing transposase RayT
LILQGKLVFGLREVFTEISQRYGWQIEEAAVVADHVHLFVSARKYALAQIVQIYQEYLGSSDLPRIPGSQKIFVEWGTVE